MRLAQKLMLINSIVLGVTIIVFAVQLISVANHSTELAFLKDTQKLLKDSKSDIANKIDICYRVGSSLSSDYDIISYLNNWDKSDKTTIFDFNLALKKKYERIMFLSPDVYQFRAFISNPRFPEIGSVFYSDTRLANRDSLFEELMKNPSGYWMLNHVEDNFNLETKSFKHVVSLYTLLKFSSGRNLGIVEVAVPTDVFFRHIISQSDNKNVLACVIGSDGHVLYSSQNGFMEKYKLDNAGLEALCANMRIKGASGSAPVVIGHTRMNMVYDSIDEIGCSICYIVTNDNITKSIGNTTVLIILESIASLVVLSFIIYFLIRMVFKKLKQIIASMRKVEEGRLDVRVAETGQDEMSEVAHHFNRMLNRIVELISEVINKQEAKKNAEIRALFAQINSHFVINVLEDIKMMAEVDCKYEVSDSITSLGKLLRYSLKWTTEFSLLKEEIEYIKNYVSLVNMRFDNVVRLETDIPSELMDYRILKVSLQPIVENAIYRGIQPLARDGLLKIHGWRDDEFTRIEVTDDGQGMDVERLNAVRKCIASGETLSAGSGASANGSGIGLRNVSERIQLVYGDKYGVEIYSEKGVYTKVVIRLPAVVQ
jgi:two-component system, sensor histidine kinase YesM